MAAESLQALRPQPAVWGMAAWCCEALNTAHHLIRAYTAGSKHQYLQSVPFRELSKMIMRTQSMQGASRHQVPVARERPATAVRAAPVQATIEAVDVAGTPSAVLPRRLALMGLSSLVLLPAFEAQAAYKSELCVMQDSEEEADECRRSRLQVDAGKQEDYGAVSDRKFTTVTGVPVSVLDSEYVRASNELILEIETYCTLDPYNKERIALSKKLKADGVAWVSKYARGGSARSLSARRLYIAVDGVIGFLSSNGLAPYPKQKVKTTLETIEQAKAFLAEGK